MNFRSNGIGALSAFPKPKAGETMPLSNMGKAAARYKLKPAKIDELKQVVGLENKAWPPPKDAKGAIQASTESFRSRIEKGCLLVLKEEKDDRDTLIGMITVQRVDLVTEEQIMQALWLHETEGILSWGRLVEIGFPKNWYEATANGKLDWHKPDGRLAWLVAVSVDPEKRGHHLVDEIISATLRIMHTKGINYVVGYGRLPQLHELHQDPNEAIAQLKGYLERMRTGDGLNPDYGVRFHQRNGATVVSPIPYSMAAGDDWESLGHGFLALYDLKKVVE